MPGGRPFIYLPTERISEAVSSVRDSGRQENTAEVARAIGIHRRTLTSKLALSDGIRGSFGIVRARGRDWKAVSLPGVYRKASVVLKEANKLPAPQTLSEYLGVTRGTVIRFMRTHAALAKEIGFVSDNTARVWHEGKKMIIEGLIVTRADLAIRAEVHYVTLVNRILKAHPNFVTDLQIVWDTRKKRAWNKIHCIRKPRVRKKKR